MSCVCVCDMVVPKLNVIHVCCIVFVFYAHKLGQLNIASKWSPVFVVVGWRQNEYMKRANTCQRKEPSIKKIIRKHIWSSFSHFPGETQLFSGVFVTEFCASSLWWFACFAISNKDNITLHDVSLCVCVCVRRILCSVLGHIR